MIIVVYKCSKYVFKVFHYFNRNIIIKDCFSVLEMVDFFFFYDSFNPLNASLASI